MIFDTAIITPIHGLIVIAVFVVTSSAVLFFLKRKPTQFLLSGTNIQYAGIVLPFIISIASAWVLHSWRLALGLCVAMVGVSVMGRIDELKKLSAMQQLIAQAIIAGIVVYAGWMIPYVSNPLHGGVIFLNYPIWGIVPGVLLAFMWIIACMNAVNFLDGTDGLAVAIGAIVCGALACSSLLPATQDVRTFGLALIGFSALAAFFVWNAPPARIYLGTTGSWCIGLFIALIAMIGGGKIVTTLIVLALPILDALFVITHRMSTGVLPWKGDTTRHLHHRLAHAGVSQWNIVLIISVCTLALAAISVVADTPVKIIAFAAFAIVFFGVSLYMMRKQTI